MRATRLRTTIALAAIGASTTACFGTGTTATTTPTTIASPPASTSSTPVHHDPVEITFWSAYTNRELADYQQAFQGFQAKYPWITVKGTGGIDDTQIIAHINAGDPPDALLSFSPNNTGKFCSSGAWIDLKPYIARDALDLSIFPKPAIAFSSYKGVQCALPALADSYGLYTNTKQLAAAGYSAPPTTLSQLLEMAKKLTVRNADGTLKRIGINPFFKHYESFADALRLAYGPPWLTADGKPAIATDPRWAELMRWQKALVDWYGYRNLAKFTAASPDEFSASNDFETGRVAMQYDGEWRNAFIKAEHPNLDYQTAPFPAADAHPEMAGAGNIAGDLVAIPRGSKHPEEAWLLIQYLASDTDALVGLSNRLANLPTTVAASTSPSLTPSPQFKPFLDIFTNPRSEFSPLTPIGQDYTDTFGDFASKYQAGSVKDLAAGLTTLSQQMSDALAQAQDGVAPTP
jgi:multiple sugar transport system substrate-binding protein